MAMSDLETYQLQLQQVSSFSSNRSNPMFKESSKNLVLVFHEVSFYNHHNGFAMVV
jgi:hypothetical protein